MLWFFYWQPYEVTIDGESLSAQTLETRVAQKLDEVNTNNLTNHSAR